MKLNKTDTRKLRMQTDKTLMELLWCMNRQQS